MLGKKICEWLADLTDADKAEETGIHQPINYKNTFTNSTCVKANIHFPVDWVLLRDAVKSLILATKRPSTRSRGSFSKNFQQNYKSHKEDMSFNTQYITNKT